MDIIILEKVPASLRGELTRWMLEPKTGVFVGKLSGMVRERLWELVCKRLKGGSGLLIHAANNEQGYTLRSWGDTSRIVRDFEGLSLITIP